MTHRCTILRRLTIRIFVINFLILLTAFGQLQADNTEKFAKAGVRMDAATDLPRHLLFAEGTTVAESDFFTGFRQAFSLSNDHRFEILGSNEMPSGKRLARYQQLYKGIVLADVQCILHQHDKQVLAMSGTPRRVANLNVQPSLSEIEALKAALRIVDADKYMWEDEANESFLKAEKADPAATFYPRGELLIGAGHQRPQPENLRLIYRFDIYSAEPFGREWIDVDAHTGELVGRITRIHSEDVASSSRSLYNGIVEMTVDSVASDSFRMRETSRGNGVRTFNMRNGTSYSAAIDFTSDSASFFANSHQVGVNAHWSAEASYDYFWAHHGRNSYNGSGAVVLSYVHFANAYDNAFWDGSRMTFGDGNSFSPLATLDVVAHELAHGVTQYSAGLVYANEYGALNESFSDIFGAAVEFDKLGSAANWRMGEDMTSDGRGIRSLSNPNSHGDPDTYHGLYWAPISNNPNGSNDQGGVHTNSGVQNFWFYLLSVGGSGTNDNRFSYSVQGIGIEQAAEVAYRNLTAYLTPLSEYEDARLGTINAAIDLFGESSAQYDAVIDAWDAVGVLKPSLTAKLFMDRDSLKFLTEVNAGSDTLTVEIANYGLTELTINDVSLTGSEFELINGNTFPVSLDYEESIFVEVAFTPVTANDFTGQLLVDSDDPDSRSTVELSGRGFTIQPARTFNNYGIGNIDNGSALYQLAHPDFFDTILGTNSYSDIHGLTMNAEDNILHATINIEGHANIAQIDAAAANVAIRATFENLILRSLAFGADGKIFACHFVNGKLYELDIASESATEIGATGIPLLRALAYDGARDRLLGANFLGSLYEIDVETGVSTFLASTGHNQFLDLEWDANDDLLFGLTGSNGNENTVHVIDPLTYQTSSSWNIGFIGLTSIVFDITPVAIAETPANMLPSAFALEANYPNPFNPTTTIRYSLPVSTSVELAIYNTVGQKIVTLASGRESAGYQAVTWDGRDDSGNTVASGIYIYRLTAGSFQQSAKMILMK